MEDTTKTWGVRGISADVRQAVITQSQKQGMKAGEWLFWRCWNVFKV